MVINKNASKIENLSFIGCFFFIKICWNSFCFFIVWPSFSVHTYITPNPWIIRNICSISTSFTTTCRRIPNIIFFTYIMFFTLTSIFIIFPLLFWVTFSIKKFTFTFAWYMLSLCFWFIYSCNHVEHACWTLWKSSVWFRTYTLLDKLLKVLQFPTHLSNLTPDR